jgi:hypothetical protein
MLAINVGVDQVNVTEEMFLCCFKTIKESIYVGGIRRPFLNIVT